MRNQPQAPTIDERGNEAHPAFGSISVTRISAHPGEVLFDSEIAHQQLVRVRLGGMRRQRDLNRDWLSPTETMVEIDMSESQWAAFVSSFNTNGVPCTLRRTETTPDVPGLELDSRLALSAQETRNAAHESLATIQAAFEEVKRVGVNGKVSERKAAQRSLEIAMENAPKNIEFAADSLTRHTENVVTKARADIEAMVVSKAETLGIEPAALRADVVAGILAAPQ